MRRLELDYLKKWAELTRRKPIVIRGARQVGKSTLVRLLAERTRLLLIELNFERHPEYAELFKSNDPSEIIKLLALQFKTEIIPGKVLIFLDEIQAVPSLLKTLRYFYEDLPQLHVIAAGSLLEFTLAESQFPMPVGRIEYMYLGPMTFEAFLLALGEQPLYEFLQNYQLGQAYPSVIHDKLMRLLKVYLIVGGMPEAIFKYIEHNDFLESEKAKHSILDTYVDDFGKYASGTTMQDRLRLVFNKVPTLVGKKLKCSHISQVERPAAVAEALNKLCLARILYQVHHSACNGIPLGAEINEKIYKMLFLDVGLISTRLDLSYLDITGLEDVTLINSGAIAEQFIGQHLLYLRPSYEKPALYYWMREKKSSSAEIDYVVSMGQKIIPIEVKAGKTGTLKSLHYFIYEKSTTCAVRFNAQRPSILNARQALAQDKTIDYQLISLPHYFVGQLYRLLGTIDHF